MASQAPPPAVEAASASSAADAVDASPAPATEEATATVDESALQAIGSKQSDIIGAATDDGTIAAPATSGAPAPVLALTLQLTTGARHPYKIDQKYLTNRKVEAVTQSGEFDPRELSGYKLKELIWTDWRGEWEPRPASPSSIRLIYMGKLLEDKKALKEYTFSLNTPSIVHMTIKPAEFDDEETAAKGTKSTSVRAQQGEDRDAGCRCVIL